MVLCDYLDRALEAGIDEDDEVRLSVGWVMFFRWLLTVKKDGETRLEGMFLFLAGMLTHVVVMFIAAVVGGLIIAVMDSETLGTLVIGLALLYGLATSIMNVKAWLAPSV